MSSGFILTHKEITGICFFPEKLPYLDNRFQKVAKI
jgi:hypothetical protein